MIMIMTIIMIVRMTVIMAVKMIVIMIVIMIVTMILIIFIVITIIRITNNIDETNYKIIQDPDETLLNKSPKHKTIRIAQIIAILPEIILAIPLEIPTIVVLTIAVKMPITVKQIISEIMVMTMMMMTMMMMMVVVVMMMVIEIIIM